MSIYVFLPPAVGSLRQFADVMGCDILYGMAGFRLQVTTGCTLVNFVLFERASEIVFFEREREIQTLERNGHLGRHVRDLTR